MLLKNRYTSKVDNYLAVNGTKVVGAPLNKTKGGSNTPCKVTVVGVAATHPVK